MFIYIKCPFICIKVWFQNRRAKMRRQLKLQGQLARPYANTDNDETPEEAGRSLRQQAQSCDVEACERRQGEADGCLWTKAAGSALSVCTEAVTQRSGKWPRRDGPSSEELRSCSIAKLRAKAREHEAGIQGGINMSGGDKKAQTQEADAPLHD